MTENPRGKMIAALPLPGKVMIGVGLIPAEIDLEFVPVRMPFTLLASIYWPSSGKREERVYEGRLVRVRRITLMAGAVARNPNSDFKPAMSFG